MVSDAQKRASANYAKRNVKQFILKFYPADAELYEHLQQQPMRNAYLKQLIRKDMER